MTPSELLRSEQRVNQVNKQNQGRDSGYDVIHNSFSLESGSYNLSQAFAKAQNASKNTQPMKT